MDTIIALSRAGLSILLLISIAYAAGRVHQWYRYGMDRDGAFRDGYNEASRSLFRVAARMHSRVPGETTTGSVRRPPVVTHERRHSAEDRDAATRAITPEMRQRIRRSI